MENGVGAKYLCTESIDASEDAVSFLFHVMYLFLRCVLVLGLTLACAPFVLNLVNSGDK